MREPIKRDSLEIQNKVTLWYLRNVGSRSPISLYTPVLYIKIHPLVGYKSALDYLQHLIQCKCNGDSGQEHNKLKLWFSKLSVIFSSNMSNPWLVDSTDVQAMDIEGRL